MNNALLPKKDQAGRVCKVRGKDEYIYEKQTTEDTVPNFEFLFANDTDIDSHPCEWFDF